MISILIDIFHLLFLLIPFIVYFLPFPLVNKYYKYIILLLILTPLHWKLLDDKCILSIATNKMGNNLDDSKNHPFTEKYLRWLYEPIMKLLDWPWDEKHITKMVYLNWILIFLVIWHYIFFYNPSICNN